MPTAHQPTRRTHRAAITLAASALVLAVVWLAGGGSEAVAADTTTTATTCPTVAYTTATAGCSPSTTTAGEGGCPGVAAPDLSVDDRNGSLTWRAAPYPAAASGSTVALLVDGRQVATASAAGGCADPGAGGTVAVCLAAGTHQAVAVDQGYPASTTATFQVAAGPCAPAGAAGQSGLSAAANPAGGSLAFTGADLAALVAVAAAALALGLAVTRAARRRRAR